jgi:PEGA domain-containing protein
MRTHPMSHILVDSLPIPVHYLGVPRYQRTVARETPMLRPALMVSALLMAQAYATAQDQANRNEVPVEVVATASEYVSQSTTISHPAHAYTDCHGSTSYLGDFRGFEDSDGSISGTVTGTADTDTHCSSTFSPPSESTLTTYRRVNYTIVKSDQALHLLSCTQVWRLTLKERLLIAAVSGSAESADKYAARAKGGWSDCPTFGIGAQYTLRIHNASDARLVDSTGTKPIKLEYLSSVPLSALPAPAPARQPQDPSTTGEAKVHITSSPSGGEIYVDGKFFGSTPSDITLTPGEHIVRVTVAGKEWSRSVQITAGEIRLQAEIAEK